MGQNVTVRGSLRELEAVDDSNDSCARGGQEGAGGRNIAWGRGEGGRGEGSGRRGGGCGGEVGGEGEVGGLPAAAVEEEEAAARAERKREGDGTPTNITDCEAASTTADPGLTLALQRAG